MMMVKGNRDGLCLPDTGTVIDFFIWGVFHPWGRVDGGDKGGKMATEEEEQ